MRAYRIKAAVVLFLAISAFAGAKAWRPTQRLAATRPPVELPSMFPKAFGSWAEDNSMPAQLVSPDAAALLDKLYNQTLSRTYINSNGYRIMLSVAYGGDQSDGTRAHRPEVCYPAQGFEILSARTGQLGTQPGSIPVRQLVARQGSRIEPITYWMIVGDSVTTTGTQSKLAQLRYSSRGIVPDGMMIRISSIDTDSAEAYRQQSEFAFELRQALSPSAKLAVFGSAGA
jgi:EpsI family protein